MSEKKKLFYSLERIMNKLNLDEETVPASLENWHNFIDRLNNCFYDFQQEHYLLERSMEISSNEYRELNENFEQAEKIAHIGNWIYSAEKNKVTWSKGIGRILKMDIGKNSLQLPDFITLFEEEYQPILLGNIAQAIKHNCAFEMETRVKTETEEKKWMFIRSEAVEDEKETQKLTGIMMDITGRKNSEKRLHELNQKLITLSRKAGMSDIAVSVLHNIGNVLNSVNTSIAIIREKLETNKLQNLDKVAAIIQDALGTVKELKNEEKIKLLPDYLNKLSKILQEDYEEIFKESTQLETNVKHINEIVFMQNHISGHSSLKESVDIAENCELALQMSGYNKTQNNIHIIKNYHYRKPIITDKSKLLQILVNLFTNAKDSIKADNKDNNSVYLTVDAPDTTGLITISVEDTGGGISPENMDRIFSMGFSTKKGGHGFGLHSSAIAAKELGGELSLENKGENIGAKFILKLPIDPNGKHHASRQKSQNSYH